MTTEKKRGRPRLSADDETSTITIRIRAQLLAELSALTDPPCFVLGYGHQSSTSCVEHAGAVRPRGAGRFAFEVT